MILNKRFYNRRGYLGELIKAVLGAIRLFIKSILRRDLIETKQFPENIQQHSRNFRGRPFLVAEKNGKPTCISCGLCEINCPADCIILEGNKRKKTAPTKFELDLLKCIYCGMCVEACPVDAIRMSQDVTYSGLAQRKWKVNN